MTTTQSISAAFILCSLVLLAVRPDPSVAVSVFCTTALFVAVTWLERKQNAEFDQLAAQVKDLKNQINAISLSRGLGR